MKRVFGVLACILAFALFAYLILVDYPSMKQELTPKSIGSLPVSVSGDLEQEREHNQDDSALPETQEPSEVPENGDEALKSEEQLEDLYAQCAPSKVALCFYQINDSAYDELYPLLNRYGLVGTLVLHDGQLPGDNGKISTAACQELTTAGWTFAVGGSSDIDMVTDPEAAAEELDHYLDRYLERIRVRIAVTADTFIFGEGEYQEVFDEVLEAHGFTKVLYVPDGVTQISSTDDLEKIPYYSISQSTDLSEAVQTAQNYGNVVLTTRLVTAEADDTMLDYTVADYEPLLQTLADDALTGIVSLTELSADTKGELQTREDLLEQIRTLEDMLG